jgi:hypothetical protein
MRLGKTVYLVMPAVVAFFPACSQSGAGGTGANANAQGNGGGEWQGVVSCMHLTGADTSKYAEQTGLNASTTATGVVLTDVSVSQPGYDCSGLRLEGVANGAGSTASSGFELEEQEADCTDELDGAVTVSGQGFIAGDRLQLTLFLFSEDPTNAAQCFYMLER